jgi:methylmalonyl-CoA/ethylmalonyl-CoA epimerase
MVGDKEIVSMRGKFLVAAMVTAASLAFSGVQHVARAADDSGVDFDISINHIGISVPDFDASVKWYEEMFGFKLVRKLHKDSNPEMDFGIIQRGPVRLELFQVVKGKPLPDYRKDPTADLYVHGVKHFAFQVKNIKKVLAELKAKGVEVSKPLEENPRTSFVFIKDNAGNSLELIEPKQ